MIFPIRITTLYIKRKLKYIFYPNFITSFVGINLHYVTQDPLMMELTNIKMQHSTLYKCFSPIVFLIHQIVQ